METLCGLFDSPLTGMGLHVRECVKDMIFILNPSLTSLRFLESWSFNNHLILEIMKQFIYTSELIGLSTTFFFDN